MPKDSTTHAFNSPGVTINFLHMVKILIGNYVWRSQEYKDNKNKVF